jgi:hypothetical protein
MKRTLTQKFKSTSRRIIDPQLKLGKDYTFYMVVVAGGGGGRLLGA